MRCRLASWQKREGSETAECHREDDVLEIHPVIIFKQSRIGKVPERIVNPDDVAQPRDFDPGAESGAKEKVAAEPSSVNFPYADVVRPDPGFERNSGKVDPQLKQYHWGRPDDVFDMAMLLDERDTLVQIEVDGRTDFVEPARRHGEVDTPQARCGY